MADREKVIKALECCAAENRCSECPYAPIGGCMMQVQLDAAELLKEQEPEMADEILPKLRKGGEVG